MIDPLTQVVAARQHHIPELLAIHADELAYLWGQRRAAMHDTRYTLTSFLELNERVEAHVAGLLAVPAALPELLGQRLLASEDRDDAFAAAYGLLRLTDVALTAKVVDALAGASGAVLLGLRDALSFASFGAAEPALQSLLAQGDDAHALAAATVLAHHDRLPPLDARFCRLLLAPEPAHAQQAWRVLTRLDGQLATTPAGVPPRPYQPAFSRPDDMLRAAVFGAGLWSARPWALRGLRQQAAGGDRVALDWLAGVGAAEDLELVTSACAATLPPGQQPALLARFGHPQVLPRLVDTMRGADAFAAAAAGAAFARVTGEDVRGVRATPPPRDDADDFAREMAEPVWLPDAGAAEAWLRQHGTRLAEAARWNRGLPLGAEPTTAVLARIDLPARWDACARAAAAGRPLAGPPPAL